MTLNLDDPDELRAYAEECLASLRRPGTNWESVECGIVHAPEAILPILIEFFRAESDVRIAAEIVGWIWQHRNPDTIEFLGEAVLDPRTEVWMQALDGLVCLWAAEHDARPALERARAVCEARGDNERLEWIDEGLEQCADEYWDRGSRGPASE